MKKMLIVGLVVMQVSLIYASIPGESKPSFPDDSIRSEYDQIGEMGKRDLIPCMNSIIAYMQKFEKREDLKFGKTYQVHDSLNFTLETLGLGMMVVQIRGRDSRSLMRFSKTNSRIVCSFDKGNEFFQDLPDESSELPPVKKFAELCLLMHNPSPFPISWQISAESGENYEFGKFCGGPHVDMFYCRKKSSDDVKQ